MDRVVGPITSGGKRIGQGRGCKGDPTFEFTLSRGRIQGSVYLTAGGTDVTDVQARFRANRPGVGGSAKLGGIALGPVIAEQSWNSLASQANEVEYGKRARHPENYANRLIYERGQVLQVLGDGALVSVTRSATGSWTDLVFVSYTSIDRVLARDLVDFIGTTETTYG